MATKTKATPKRVKKTAKPKEMTLTQAKAECARLGLEVAMEYDKRYKNTWLYTLGKDVEPVLRSSIVHKKKPAKKKLSWKELATLAEDA